MVVVAGGSRVVVVPVMTHISDVSAVEEFVAALCGTEDVALVVVPVFGPTVNCSLFHFEF